MNKEALKKHHYWILSGVAPLFTLLAVVMFWTSVGAKVEEEQKEISGKLSELTSAQPKGKKVLSDLDEQVGVLDKKRDELWKENWNRQAVQYKLFTWPQDNDPRQRLKRMEEKYQKFGEKMRDPDDAFEVFKRKEVYEAAYDRIANSIKPTVFPNEDWRGVFRHVNNWGVRKPTSDQIWLALEDYWLQRAIVQPVNVINNGAAKFERVPNEDGQDNPFKRTFQSRVWKIELEIPTSGPDAMRVMRAKITNTTDRLQLMGINNRMRLKVWLSTLPTAQPIDFRLEGEFVKAGDTKEIPLVRRYHELPRGIEVEEIARVEQVLDVRTVPVRQVMNFEMQYLDSRHAKHELVAPEFLPEVEAPMAGTGEEFGDADGGMPAPAFGPGGGFGSKDGRKSKAGAPKMILDDNRLRYFDSTDQVRRIPVAIVLLVDQMFMQDALVAYTNSPLRFQITQFHWRRYRGKMSTSSGGMDGDGYVDDGGQEFAGSPLDDFGGEEDYGMSGPQGFGADFGPGSFGSRAGSVSPEQVTSGLVELTIYGVASLYEKFEPKETEGEGDENGDDQDNPMPSGPDSPMTAAGNQDAKPEDEDEGNDKDGEQP